MIRMDANKRHAFYLGVLAALALAAVVIFFSMPVAVEVMGVVLLMTVLAGLLVAISVWRGQCLTTRT